MICRSFKHFSEKHANNFVPLPNQPENNDIPVQTPPTGFDALHTIALSRIYLRQPRKLSGLAQVALSCGADDLHGTIIEERIFHMVGATSPQLQTEAEMIKAIREAGRAQDACAFICLHPLSVAGWIRIPGWVAGTGRWPDRL